MEAMAIMQISTLTNENTAMGQCLEDEAQCYPTLSWGSALFRKLKGHSTQQQRLLVHL